MKPSGCKREQEWVGGLRDAFDAELEKHLEQCQECSDAKDLRASLRQLAKLDRTAVHAPSASQLWWRSKILRDLAAQDEQADRVARPIRWAGWAWLFTAFSASLMLAPQVSGFLTDAFLSWTFQDPTATVGVTFSSLRYLLVGLCGLPLGASIILWWMFGRI